MPTGKPTTRCLPKGYDPEELKQRLLSRAVFFGECWLWDGPTNGRYCQIKLGYPKRLEYVHRLSYWLFNGPINKGLVIDHICLRKTCFNPVHLDAVTTAENNRRARASTNRIH